MEPDLIDSGCAIPIPVAVAVALPPFDVTLIVPPSGPAALGRKRMRMPSPCMRSLPEASLLRSSRPCRGVSVKREIANGLMEGPARVFHRDPEDERVLKIIVYLSDVDEGAGPFQCLDAVGSDQLMAT